MEKLRNHFSKIKVPSCGDKVYKDECMFSFDTPDSETGLYVCLNTFLGWGKDHVSNFSERTGNQVFLHLKRIKKEIPVEKENEPEKKIAKLAIGVEGGFNPDAGKKKYEFEEHNSIVILPEFDVIPLPNQDLPEIVLQSIAGIMKAESPNKLAELETEAKAWDGDVRQVSKHANNLKQLDNGIKIPPSGWKCEMCDKTDNLWLNLTDGKILCGRRQLDGSGGNNHAVEHYSNVGHPLAVKLGTITADGKADVYSYDEDDMVLDPHITKHLAHFGINILKMEKTEKTMLELEIDYNQRAWEWSRLTESGASLQPMYGPGYAGLRNLGNSCYMNSVMQVLMMVPSFRERYYDTTSTILNSCSPQASPKDFNVQMCKLTNGLLSGKYSTAPVCSDEGNKDIDDTQPGVSPLTFRLLVGEGHSEFSTKRQQDAMEFLEHVLKLVTRNCSGKPDPGHCFKFEVEDKFVCTESQKVRYVTRSDLYLPFPVPMEESTNKEEVQAFLARKAEAEANKTHFTEEQLHHTVPFAACLSRLVAPEEISAYSSAVKKDVLMQKITRLQTFPDYLFIQLVKFGIGADWQPLKYDVSVNMPQELDLSVLKGNGLQPGEEELPEEAAAASSVTSAPSIDEAVVQQLSEMGFPPQACRKAVQLTGNSGSEMAMNWIMEHIGDADFADPLPESSVQGGATKKMEISEDGISMLTCMGFTREQATLALEETSNNLERAADWIFSHQHQLDSLLAAKNGQKNDAVNSSAPVPHTDGSPKYELVAFISHMGTSIHVGHYVCHVKKDGEWVIFNDNKVCKSVNPPTDLGYIYLYKRSP